MPARRKATDEELLAAYADTGSVRAAGERFGMLGSSAHERLVKLGAVKPVNSFTDQDADRLRADTKQRQMPVGFLILRPTWAAPSSSFAGRPTNSG